MNLKKRIAKVAKYAGINPKHIKEYPGLLQTAKEFMEPGEEYPEGYDELGELKRIQKGHKYRDPCWRDFKPKYLECQYCGGFWHCLDMRIALLEAKLDK